MVRRLEEWSDMTMTLEMPDLCAQLDRMRKLCDRLEEAQNDPVRYREIVRSIQVEIEIFRDAICRHQPADFSKRTA
jgi:hypothetical protein